MKNKLYFPATVFVSVVIFWGSVSYATIPENRTIKGPSPDETGSAPKKWEHCSLALINGLTKNGTRVTATAMINYVQDAGLRTEKVEATIDESSSKSAKAQDTVLAKAIGKLGTEGWELVGEGTLLSTLPGEQKVLYFKRAVN